WPVSSACRPRSRVVFNSAGNSPSEPVISTSPESILANNSSSAPLAWSWATSSLPVVEEVPFSSVIVISCCVSFQHGLHRKLNTPAGPVYHRCFATVAITVGPFLGCGHRTLEPLSSAPQTPALINNSLRKPQPPTRSQRSISVDHEDLS